MGKNYPEVARDLTERIGVMRKGIPDTMAAFSAIAKSATAAGALDAKTKELIAVAIAVAVRCDGCIAFHVKAAVRLGASREEMMETIGMGIYMGGGPSMVYGADTLAAFDQFAAESVNA